MATTGKGGSSLRPSVAWALLQLAAVKPADVLLDSMAGEGTLPIEGAAAGRALGLGGEILAPLAEQLAANARRYRASQAASASSASARPPRGPVEFVRWDAARLPLRAGCADVAVVDLPFGVRCGSADLNERLYPAALAELARVLRPGGRLVLMTLARKLLFATVLEAARWWHALEAHEANIGGLCVVVLVLRRTPAPPPVDPSARGGGCFLAEEGQTLKGGARWTE